jgi:predicted nucleic acid-binding Zn ribbon protein
MAIHVYDCPDGHQFEVVEPASKEGRPKCPACGKRARLGVGRTGTPILRRGVGGFHKPSLDPLPKNFDGEQFHFTGE